MASLTRWTWVWVNSESWWWTGRPGVLGFMGLQRVGHDWATELNWTDASNVEKGMATHSSTLAWKIPWTEEPGRLQSMGSQRVGHEWVTFTFSLASCFTRGSVYMSVLLSQSVLLYPSAAVSTNLIFMSASPFLPCKYFHQYYFSGFHIYVSIYDICISFSVLLHSEQQALHSIFWLPIVAHLLVWLAVFHYKPVLSGNSSLGKPWLQVSFTGEPVVVGILLLTAGWLHVSGTHR